MIYQIKVSECKELVSKRFTIHFTTEKIAKLSTLILEKALELFST